MISLNSLKESHKFLMDNQICPLCSKQLRKYRKTDGEVAYLFCGIVNIWTPHYFQIECDFNYSNIIAMFDFDQLYGFDKVSIGFYHNSTRFFCREGELLYSTNTAMPIPKDLDGFDKIFSRLKKMQLLQ